MIDPAQRRNAIADALFEVVRDGGFDRVSLARVAERAGLAIGSVRHFLGSREELITFAFDTMTERIEDRVLGHLDSLVADGALDRMGPAERLAATVDVLSELLPLDEPRRAEALVWVEFETAARTEPALAARSDKAARGSAGLIRQILANAAGTGTLGAGRDLDVEAARLTALVDGLTLRGVLHPDLLDPEMSRQVLHTHLAGLRDPVAQSSP